MGFDVHKLNKGKKLYTFKTPRGPYASSTISLIAESKKDAIEKLKKKGTKFYPSTGKMHKHIR